MAMPDDAQSDMQQLRRVSELAAIDPDLDGTDLRVFLYLSSRLGFDEFALVSQVEMATMLGKRKEHISRAMRTLEDRGIIVPGPKVGRSVQWRLNPDYGNGTKH